MGNAERANRIIAIPTIAKGYTGRAKWILQARDCGRACDAGA